MNQQSREHAGSAEAWQATGSGEKKIWVDFSHDLIAILNHRNESPTHISVKSNDPLYLMTKYAKEKTRKIQRLAVSECWYPASQPARQDRHPHTYIRQCPVSDHPTHGPGFFDEMTGFHREPAASYLRKALKDFKNIKELEAYEIGGRPVPAFIDELQIVENNFLEEDMAVWRAKLLDVFELAKQATPEWTTDLPKIVVRKGLHGLDDRWDGTIVT